MSLYKIFRCSFQSHLFRSTNEIIFQKNLKIKFIPLAVKISTSLHSKENENEAINKVVYVGPLSKQIARVKLFSLITSMTGLFAQPVIYERSQELQVSTPVLFGLCTIVGFFTFVTPLLLHYITRKYVTLVTYDEKNDIFTATVITLFLRKKKITFTPGEPKVPDILGLFTSMTVRGIPLFIDAKYFDDITYYKKIMGYDKPIDFKLASVDRTEQP